MKRASTQLNSEYLTLLFDPVASSYNVLSDTLMLKDIGCYFVLFAGQKVGFRTGKVEVDIGENKARMSSGGNLKLIFEATLPPDAPYLICRLSLSNQGKRELYMDRAVLLDCALPEEMGDELVVLDNPDLSSEPTVVRALSGRDSAGTAKRPDKDSTAKAAGFSSRDFAAVRDLKRRHQITLGFTSHGDFRTTVGLEGGRLLAECDLGWMRLAPGATVAAEELYIDLSTGADALLSYADRSARRMKTHVPAGLGIGFDLTGTDPSRLSESKVLRAVRALGRRGDRLKFDYVLIGNGYQKEAAPGEPGVGNWLETNERFPGGLGRSADQIRESGFRPGLWLAPFLVTRDCEIFEKHQGWLIRDARENPKPIGEWGGRTAYALDTTQPSAQEWLRDTFRILAHERGYQVFKIDHAYAGAAPGKRYDIRSNGIQAYRRGLEIIREAIGPDRHLILARAPVGPSMGLADALETAPMAAAGAQRRGKRGRPSLLETIRRTYNRAFLNGKTWYNMSGPIPLSPEEGSSKHSEVQAWATLLALSGGLPAAAGDPKKFNPSRLRLLGRIYPPYGNGGRVVGFFSQEYPSFVFLPIETDFDRWIVLGVFNWGDKPQDLSISLNRLGLKGSEEHHLFDFWKEQYLGRISNNVEVNSLPPRSCRLFRVARVRKRPQLVASSLHFSQGGAEVRYFRPKVDRVEIRVDSAIWSEAKIWLYNPPQVEPIMTRIPTNKDCNIALEESGTI